MTADPFTQALLLASATLQAGSLYSQGRANKASSKAAAAQRRQEALAAAIQRRQAFKAGRQAAAQAIQAGENQGVSGGSGQLGGAGSAVTQTNANLSFLDRQGQLADFAGTMFDKAQRWSNRAELFAGASKLAQVGYGAAADAAAQKAAQEAAATQNPIWNQIFKDNNGRPR